MTSSSAYDVAVAGGGPIGLACGWAAARRGLRTLVVDSGEPGAWHVAAGMLAPVTEAEPGDEALLELSLRSARGFAAFCAQLEDSGYREAGTLAVARDRDEAEALERTLAFRREHGLEVERLRPSQARRAEPALAPTVRLALEVPGDHSVDPRRLVAALRRALSAAGGELRHGRVEAVESDGARATGLRLADGAVVAADQVVLAVGAAAGRFGLPVRPVKGQVLRLRDRNGPGLVTRTIRGAGAYLVPRADGRYVLGATMEDRGWDAAPTAGGVYELLRDMAEIVPGVLELEIEELLAGHRPATPDNVPAIGPGSLEGLIWAAGHHRNGILLTPVTAELVGGLLVGEPLPGWAAAADPRRFTEVHA